MANLGAFCLVATPFSPSKELDEDILRQFLDRMVQSKIGLYLASGGNGEGHALSKDELRTLYRVAVEECRGKIPVQANLPEAHTAKDTIEHAQLAISQGVEVLHLYTLEQRHAMRPTDAEFHGYFDDILSVIRHPVVISANPTNGYVPSPAAIDAISKKYHQVIGLRISNMPDNALINFKDGVSRELAYYVMLGNSLSCLAIGIDGIFGSKANLIPRTIRQYMDLCDQRDFEGIGKAYTDLKRAYQHLTKWAPAGARWIKMGMKVLKLPGGEGGLRRPYLMPPEDELRKFTDGLLRLGIPEVDEMAKKAGLAIAA